MISFHMHVSDTMGDKKYHIYAREKNEVNLTRFNDEEYDDGDVAKGRADQLAFRYPSKVFSVYTVNQRDG